MVTARGIRYALLIMTRGPASLSVQAMADVYLSIATAGVAKTPSSKHFVETTSGPAPSEIGLRKNSPQQLRLGRLPSTTLD